MDIHYNIRKGFSVILLSAFLLSCAGCGSIYSSYNDVSHLELVESLGLDFQDNSFSLSLSTKEDEEEKNGSLVSGKGESFSSALLDARGISQNKQLFLSPTQYIILGEEAAKEHLKEVLDYLQRNQKLRLDTKMFLAYNNSAKNLMSFNKDEGYSINKSLSTIEAEEKNSHASYVFTCREIISSLNEFGASPISMVELFEAEDKIIPEAETLPKLSGYGILKKEGLVGILPEDLSLGVCLLMNKENYSTLSFTLDEKAFSTSIKSSSCKFSTIFEENVLKSIKVELNLVSGLTENGQGLDFTNNSTKAQMEKVQEDYIKKMLEEIFKSSIKYEADFLGLYGTLRLDHGEEMEQYKENFPKILESIDFNVNVKNQIDISYEIERGA